jgi:hypothetical protein
VQAWLNSAAAQQFTAGEFSNFFLYTPNLTDPITCNGGACPTAPPQEFFGLISAADGGSTFIYVLISMLACLGAIWFRPRRQIEARVTAV